MTTGHIEMAAEAKPSSRHRLAEVPVLRISNLCHLKRAACATFQYLSILQTPIFSLWVISLSTSASPYDAPPVSWLGTVSPNAIPDFCQEEYFFFYYYFLHF